MPIQYAIMSENPRSDWAEHGSHCFTPASQMDAEDDKENGVWAFFTNRGKQASVWAYVRLREKLNEDIAKIKPFAPLNDMFDITLNIGDYVVSSADERSKYLTVMKVVGYTKDKVKLIAYGRVISRNPAMLMRVHESVITPDPSLF